MFLETFTSRDEMERSSRWIFGLVMTLLMLGLVMVYSAKSVKSARLDGQPYAPLFSHGLKVGLGLAGMLLAMRIDYRVLGRHYLKIFLAVVAILLLVLIPGVGAEINGARRWFLVGGQMIQPSEFAKLGLIVVLAALMVRSGNRITQFARGTLPPLAAASVICFLILNEPDFGTSVIAGCLSITLLVVGGVTIRHFTVMTLILAPLLFIYAYGNLEHVAHRFGIFMDPPQGGQLDFSIMAIASGGLFGTGLGASYCKLYRIPECESDFIFSIIGEELGFLGTAAVVLIYVGLIFFGIRIVLGIKNRFGFIMAFGVLLLVSAQALVNIAVVVGLAPTKGLPLPFISSGGSSIIALMMGIGLFLNIARNPDAASEPVRDEFCEYWFHRLASPFLKLTPGERDDL
jgi:cell division protein FtsW